MVMVQAEQIWNRQVINLDKRRFVHLTERMREECATHTGEDDEKSANMGR